jgi:hypothetical protein
MKGRKKRKKTYLILHPTHLPPPLLLSLPHILEEQPPATLLRVVASFEKGVGARVARGEAESAVVAGAAVIIVVAAEY